MTSGPSRRGTVAQFDDPAGLGEVVDLSGARYPFHCVAVADGSRTIAPGASVRFRTRPGLHGRWEADEIEPLA